MTTTTKNSPETNKVSGVEHVLVSYKQSLDQMSRMPLLQCLIVKQ